LGAQQKEKTVLTLRVNGKTYQVDAEPATPLLWVLRDNIGLTGTKYGCGIAQCGACTVHVDGRATPSCVLPVSAVLNSEITTIEGLAPDSQHPVQQAWIEHDVPQCGYCQSGQIMAVAALLARNRNPSDSDINREITNICRCGTYHRIRTAIRRAGELARG
jgi:isoquinoline 1-oxidoreductase subunit alpha